MGQVLTHSNFRTEPVTQSASFTARRTEVCRMLAVSDSTLYRWEHEGIIWACDDEHPDGQYKTLPSGRKRYSLDRMWALHAVR